MKGIIKIRRVKAEGAGVYFSDFLDLRVGILFFHDFEELIGPIFPDNAAVAFGSADGGRQAGGGGFLFFRSA